MSKKRKLLRIAALVAVAAAVGIFMYRRTYNAELKALSQGPEPGTALVERRLAAIMGGVRERTDTGEFSDLVETLGFQAVPFLDAYQNASSDRVRKRVGMGYSMVLAKTKDPENRRALVDRLAARLDGPDGQWVGWQLSKLRRDDFSESTREKLRQELAAKAAGTKSVVSTGSLIVAIGVADMRSELPALKRIVERGDAAGGLQPGQERYSGTAWSALLARARMGVKEDIQRCIELVESCPDTQERVQNLFGALRYVLQPEVVEYLSTYLEREEVIEFTYTPFLGDPIVDARLPWAHFAYGRICAMLTNEPKPTAQFVTDNRQLETGVMLAQARELKEWLAKQQSYEFDG